MTPPRACVEALTSAAANGDLLVHAGNRDDILRAVLAAFVAGEPSGAWTVEYDGDTGEAGWWIVSRMDADALYCLTLRTKGEADAVANVLNYLDSLRESGEQARLEGA